MRDLCTRYNPGSLGVDERYEGAPLEVGVGVGITQEALTWIARLFVFSQATHPVWHVDWDHPSSAQAPCTVDSSTKSVIFQKSSQDES